MTFRVYIYKVDSSIITNVPLQWGILVKGEAMNVWGKEGSGKSLYLLLNFAVNLKLLLKNTVLKKEDIISYCKCVDGAHLRPVHIGAEPGSALG